jgi:DNA-directed RNA polymerase II subunit RPB2
MPPPVDSSNQKVISMRLANNVQYGYIDVVETPDGSKVGIHKHLSLMCSVTMYMDIAYITNLKNKLNTLADSNGKKYMVSFIDVSLDKIKKMIHVNLNGEWLGLTDNPFEFTNKLKELRYTNIINIHTSINFNIKTRSIDLNTDGGRFIRPLLKVENNQLKLTKEMLDSINNNIKTNIPFRWNDFIIKYPGVIEYIDVEESENLMIAMYFTDLANAMSKMTNLDINTSEGGNGNIINRYDKVYVKYSHCEFHPMVSLGVISSNIP